MLKTIVSILAVMTSLQASAAPVQLTKPHQSEIKVKVKELMELVQNQDVEKPYHCTLRGRAESPAWFSSNDALDVNLTATSLENAAKLVLSRYVIQIMDQGASVVKVSVDGQGFFVNNVDCKPVQQSI